MKLGDLAKGMKARNAGASWLSFDIPFDDRQGFERAVASEAVSAPLIARLYNVPEAAVRIFAFEAANAIKVTIPRQNSAGGPDESDFDGAQQFAPLLDIDIP